MLNVSFFHPEDRGIIVPEVFFKTKLFKNKYVFSDDFEHRTLLYHLQHEDHLVYVYSLGTEVKV